jgi:hypothetical protein
MTYNTIKSWEERTNSECVVYQCIHYLEKTEDLGIPARRMSCAGAIEGILITFNYIQPGSEYPRLKVKRKILWGERNETYMEMIYRLGYKFLLDNEVIALD